VLAEKRQQLTWVPCGALPTSRPGKDSDAMSMRTATPSRTAQGGSLQRVTVNLTPRSVEALAEACKLTDDSKTDTINRAIQVYAYLQVIVDGGGALYVRSDPDDELEKLHFI